MFSCPAFFPVCPIQDTNIQDWLNLNQMRTNHAQDTTNKTNFDQTKSNSIKPNQTQTNETQNQTKLYQLKRKLTQSRPITEANNLQKHNVISEDLT